MLSKSSLNILGVGAHCVTLALKKWSKKDKELKVILSYEASGRPACEM